MTRIPLVSRIARKIRWARRPIVTLHAGGLLVNATVRGKVSIDGDGAAIKHTRFIP